MPYVERNAQNYVVGQYGVPQPSYAEEWLDDGHPDLSIKTPEELAEEARRANVAAAKAEAKADNIVQAIRDATPAEVVNYVVSRLPSLTPAERQLIAKMAVVLSVLAKESLR